MIDRVRIRRLRALLVKHGKIAAPAPFVPGPRYTGTLTADAIAEMHYEFAHGFYDDLFRDSPFLRVLQERLK